MLSFLTVFSLAVLSVSSAPVEANIVYETRYFEQKLDHFNFINKDTFQLKYLISDAFWKPGEGAIFVYTGNEAAIEDFSNNTGFMWDIAPEFGALLLFIEHRYYGDSLPKLNTSSKEYFSYLSTVQALEDFAIVVEDVRKNLDGGKDAPVIAFGGSYGGMLAAWMRMKYPHIIHGALASSAPMIQSFYYNKCNSYESLVTRDFERESPECVKSIRRSWDVINSFNSTEEGLQYLTETFHLCEKLNSTENVTLLKYWLSEYYGLLAMVDYPYPADFLGALPGWPIKVLCSYLDDSSMEDKQLLEAIFKAVASDYNSTGIHKCIEVGVSAFDEDVPMDAWDYQVCTEIPIPSCSTGVDDMYEPSPFDKEEFIEECNSTYGVTPDFDFVNIMYGEKHLESASNIIFSNGDLDPWSEGGILESPSPSLVTVRIADAAHHLDLRGANPNDPPSVVKARELEKSYIRKWIAEYKRTP